MRHLAKFCLWVGLQMFSPGIFCFCLTHQLTRLKRSEIILIGHMQNFITIFHSVQEIGPFPLFQNLEPRPMKNVSSQSLGLDLLNINVYANVYQNIPLSSRDRVIFTFSELEPRQRLGQSEMTFDNLLGYILSISMRMQTFIKVFQTV